MREADETNTEVPLDSLLTHSAARTQHAETHDLIRPHLADRQTRASATPNLTACDPNRCAGLTAEVRETDRSRDMGLDEGAAVAADSPDLAGPVEGGCGEVVVLAAVVGAGDDPPLVAVPVFRQGA